MSTAQQPATFQVAGSFSKPCFAAGLGFREIHVESRPGDVMVGAGGAAGHAQDVRHQPPGSTKYIYHNYELHSTNAASSMVKAAGYSLLGPGFNSPLQQIFVCQEHVRNNTCLYISCMYLAYAWHKQVLDTYVHKDIWRNNMYVNIHCIDNDL
jgi:hypothetical protein